MQNRKKHSGLARKWEVGSGKWEVISGQLPTSNFQLPTRPSQLATDNSIRRSGRRAKLATRNSQLAKGFTLVEVMLVLLILMTLATVGILAVRNMGAEAKRRQASIGVAEYARALDAYYSLYDRFPTTQEGLDALRNCPASIDPSEYRSVITHDVTPDPWGMPYNYQYPGSRGGDEFDLWSNGPDMESGTADDIWKK